MAKGAKGSTPTNEEAKERFPFNIKIVNKRKLKVIAALIDLDMSAIVDKLIGDYVADYESKNRVIVLE